MKYQKGFSLIELVVVLIWLCSAVVTLGIIGVVVWAVYRFTIKFTSEPAVAMLQQVAQYFT